MLALLAGGLVAAIAACGATSPSDTPAPPGSTRLSGTTVVTRRSSTDTQVCATSDTTAPASTTSESAPSSTSEVAPDTSIVDPDAPTESSESSVPTESSESTVPTASSETSTSTSAEPPAADTAVPCVELPPSEPRTQPPAQPDDSSGGAGAPRLEALTTYLSNHFGGEPWRNQLADYKLSTADDDFQLTVAVRSTMPPDEAVAACSAIAKWSTSTFADGTITVTNHDGAPLASTTSARTRSCAAA
jgi:hypothetical protein